MLFQNIPSTQAPGVSPQQPEIMLSFFSHRLRAVLPHGQVPGSSPRASRGAPCGYYSHDSNYSAQVAALPGNPSPRGPFCWRTGTLAMSCSHSVGACPHSMPCSHWQVITPVLLPQNCCAPWVPEAAGPSWRFHERLRGSLLSPPLLATDFWCTAREALETPARSPVGLRWVFLRPPGERRTICRLIKLTKS